MQEELPIHFSFLLELNEFYKSEFIEDESTFKINDKKWSQPYEEDSKQYGQLLNKGASKAKLKEYEEKLKPYYDELNKWKANGRIFFSFKNVFKNFVSSDAELVIKHEAIMGKLKKFLSDEFKEKM